MSYKKTVILLPLTLVVLFATFHSVATKNKITSVILANKTFVVEVADTNVLQERGLSEHKPLLSNEGMLFIFQNEGNYGFWMKDMLFPIDIVWIDKNFKIIHLEKSVLPETYPKVFYPGALSLYVLELPSGQLNSLSIKIGDMVKFIKK